MNIEEIKTAVTWSLAVIATGVVTFVASFIAVVVVKLFFNTLALAWNLV